MTRNSRKKSSRVTIYDIAERANVSAMTVSRSLRASGTTEISGEVVEKIRSIAREMDYRPNTLARGLILRKTLNIGFCINRPRFNYYSPFLRFLFRSLQAELTSHGYRLGYYYFEAGRDEQFVSFLNEGRVVDSIIVLGRNLSSEEIKIIHDSEVNAIAIYEEIKGMHSLLVDDHAAGRVAAEYLWNRGFREVTLVTKAAKQKEWSGRVVGFKERTRELGLKYKEISMAWDSLYDEDYARLHAKIPSDFLSRIQRQGTAGKCLFVTSDHYALSIVRQIDAAGLKLGKDISLLGFDNMEGQDPASATAARLTTFDLPRLEIGKFAARLAMGLEEQKTTTTHRFAVPLIERSSVGWGPAASARP